MTSVFGQPLGTSAELANRLRRPPPSSGSAEAEDWTTALLDASNHLRDVVGQPITAATTTVVLDVDDTGVVAVPFCPVRSIDAVFDRAGLEITTGITRADNRSMHLPAYVAGDKVTVTVSHGYTEVPGELLRWVYMLAAARIAGAGGGTLGMGGPTTVAIDDARVGFDASGSSTEIPDAVQARLRANYGGGF